jgi:N6-adenosine-specific RNA methylase IME4
MAGQGAPSGVRAEFASLRPVGGFQFLMADPPWRYELYNEETGAAKAAQGQYDCMDLNAIKRLPVEMLAAENCVLWLWCTHPMLPQAIEVCRSWGFEYKTSGVWSKRNAETGKLAFGTGYLLRCASEPFLIATRGKPKTARNVRTVIEGPRREHSRKPEEAFQAAVQLMPKARRIELFSRQSREGWVTWGDEANKFDEIEEIEGRPVTTAASRCHVTAT